MIGAMYKEDFYKNQKEQITEPSNTMAVLALGCGIVSVMTFLFGIGIIFAALGITFALLSRREHLSRRALQGLVFSGVSLGLFTASMLFITVTLQQIGMLDVMKDAYETVDFSDASSVAAFEDTIETELIIRLYGEDALEYFGLAPGSSDLNSGSAAESGAAAPGSMPDISEIADGGTAVA